jgi:hypothetical protein
MANNCKMFFLVEIRILWSLNKYIFSEKKYKNILEKYILKIYMCTVKPHSGDAHSYGCARGLDYQA